MSTSTDLNWVPPARTLPPVDRPLRQREYARLWHDSLLEVERVDSTHAELRLQLASLESAQDLATRETSCCSFFAFDVAVDNNSVLMRVGVPEQHIPVLDALLAAARSAADLEPV